MKIKNFETKKNLLTCILILIIALFLEVIVFNITSYRILFGNYESRVYEENDLEFLYYANNKAYLKINDINMNVGTFKLKLKEDEDLEVSEYKILYSDETSSEHWELNSKYIISGEEKTQYMPLYLSGKTNSLIVAVDENLYESDMIEKIILNEKIPIEFNKTRFVCILVILVFIYFMKNGEELNKEYSPKNLKQEMILLGILAVFFIVLTFINVYSCREESFGNGILSTFSTNEGLYNKELVEGIVNGKLYILQEPSEDFLNLENPYDSLKRDVANRLIRDTDFKWDTAYYNGHFYIYFGILPLLIIFLPYYLLTGIYLKILIVTYGISILIFILLKEILLKLLNRYFKNIPFKLVIYSLITICSGTLILYANGMSRVYEMVILFGLYCVLQGIFFILKALENEKNRHLNILLGSIFLSLSVACRPTDLFASILIIPFLLSLFLKYIKNIKENKNNLIKLILSVAIPYITVAIALMWYNYARFGNVFDFGTKYQLTINNMKTLGSRIFAIPVGVICNLFTIPKFIPDFPFIEKTGSTIVFYGYYYIEQFIGGLFFIAPICFMSLFIFKINKKIENKELKIIINTLLIIGLMLAISSTYMAGSNERYLIDYAWMIILAGILIFIFIYNYLQSKEAKRILEYILCVTTIYTFIVGIISGIITEGDYMRWYSPKEYYKTKYTICFWE